MECGQDPPGVGGLAQLLTIASGGHLIGLGEVECAEALPLTICCSPRHANAQIVPFSSGDSRRRRSAV